MRFKKGFTLAEILIVLMVIGALASMTIPALMKGVTETQWKTVYKKAYNAIVNLCTMERVSGSLPSSPDETGIKRMFEILHTNLTVKDFVASSTVGIDSGTLAQPSDFKPAVSYVNSQGITYGTAVVSGSSAAAADQVDASFTTVSPWIVSEDNIAYVVTKGSGTNCGTKQTINEQTTTANAIGKACAIVVVDVNGLSNGPNKVEIQDLGTSTTAMAALSGDQYYIFVGYDGATAGNKRALATGRIAGDLK